MNIALILFSDKNVPAYGYVVRDGGFVAIVVNPEGITLGGDFSGLHVPAGTSFVFGNHSILVEKNRKKWWNPHNKPQEIIIRFKSTGPVYVSPEGYFEIAVELEHEKWGKGLGQGFWKPRQLADGRVKAFIRNVLTFSGLGEIPIE